MRAAVTILLVSAVGIHCGPDNLGPPPAEEDVAAAGDEAAPPRLPRMSTDDDSAGADARWGTEAEGSPPTLITTTARGDDDALYAAGTFRGTMTLGTDTLTSKGGDDVFLVRFDPDGAIAWTRAVGSVRAERQPRVTFAGGKVRLLAQTEGEVDCGSGAMGKWSSEMFFFCLFDTDGAAMGGGTFPTGSP